MSSVPFGACKQHPKGMFCYYTEIEVFTGLDLTTTSSGTRRRTAYVNGRYQVPGFYYCNEHRDICDEIDREFWMEAVKKEL